MAGTTADDRDGVCRRLRWKGLFVESEPDPSVPPSSDVSCWCTRTMTCLGPDGKVVRRASCQSGRACFEPLGVG